MAKQKSLVRRRTIKSVGKSSRNMSLVAQLVRPDERKQTNPNVSVQKMQVPEPPRELLDENGLRKWNIVARLLIDRGLLTDLDYDALMLYCDAYSDFCRAVLELNKTGRDIMKQGKGNGGQYRNAWYDIKKRASQEMSQYLAILGLSPMDRKKMGALEKQPGKAPPNDFDEF